MEVTNDYTATKFVAICGTEVVLRTTTVADCDHKVGTIGFDFPCIFWLTLYRIVFTYYIGLWWDLNHFIILSVIFLNSWHFAMCDQRLLSTALKSVSIVLAELTVLSLLKQKYPSVYCFWLPCFRFYLNCACCGLTMKYLLHGPVKAPVNDLRSGFLSFCLDGHQGPLLPTWFNFNPSMDK